MPPIPQTRKRNTVIVGGTAVELTYFPPGTLVSTSRRPWASREIQETTSEGHPYTKVTGKKKRKRYLKSPKRKSFDGLDLGGPFNSTKTQIFPRRWDAFVSNTANPSLANYTYSGPITAALGLDPSHGAPLTSVLDAQLDAWGTIAISRVLPTNPLAGMGQFLGELRDLPKLPGLALMKARAKKMAYSKALASEYLNYQFGWLPFANDLIKFAEVVAKKDEIIAQYERDSGRLVRRKIVLFENTSTVSTVESTNSFGNPTLVPSYYLSGGTLTKTVTTTHRVWFSGAFTYFLASGKTPAKIGKQNRNLTFYEKPKENFGSTVRRRAQILSKLYGLRADPYLFYQLFPWSWLVDWFTSLGPIVKNLVAFSNDGLVMKYGYVMSYKRETTTYTLTGLRFKNVDAPVLVDVLVKHRKQRRKATPYGFGLNPVSFNARQWSILAALGISRAPKSLSY